MTQSSQSDRLLSADELAEMFGVERENIGRWARDRMHGFPPPLRLTEKTLRWKESDINQWINQRTETDDGEQDSVGHEDHADITATLNQEVAEAQEPPRPTGLVDELCGGQDETDWPEEGNPCDDPI